MNPIAAKLGEVGLPAPVAELAPRQWDAVVVGGGHNGLTAAAYLAKAGWSVLVLERRERLGGACTLERPFDDQGFQISPCAYVVGLLDETRHRRARAAPPRLRVLGRRPEPVGPVRGRHVVRAVARRRQDAGRARGARGLQARHRGLLGLRARLRRDPQAAAHRRARHVAGRVPDPRGDRGAAARRADDARHRLRGLDRRGARRVHRRPAPEGRALRPGRDRRLRRAEGPRHRVDQAHALPGRPRGPGPGVGLRQGRHGDDLASRSPTPPPRPAPCSRAGSRSSEILPGEGVMLEDGTSISARVVVCNADPKVALRLLGDGDVLPADYRTRLEEWKVRSPVVKFNAALTALPEWTAAPGETWPARATIDLTGGLEDAQRAFEACDRGEPAVGFGEIYIQTGYDPSPAPEGHHLLSVFGQYAPYELAERHLGLPPRRGRPAVHHADRALRARLREPARGLRGARPARHRGAHRADRRQHLPGRGHPGPDVDHRLSPAHAGRRACTSAARPRTRAGP